MKTPAPHFSYPKRDRYFADTKRLGRAPEAPMAVDVPTDFSSPPWETEDEVRQYVEKVREDYTKYMQDTRNTWSDLPSDWAETQGDLAPVVRKINTALLCGVLVMAGWVAGCLMALAALKGWL